MTKRGFTLIETIVYLGLFAIIMGGLLVAAYNLIEGSKRTQSIIGVQEEGIFLNRKLSWAIAGATSAGTVGPSTLSLDRSNDLPTDQTPLKLTLDGTSLMLTRGSHDPVPLNGDKFPITNLSFTVIHTSGKPDSVSATFYIAGQLFKFDTYLRK